MSADDTTTTVETSESLIHEVIASIYYTRRHAENIPPIKEKITHLKEMLTKMEAEQNVQASSDSLENNLIHLQEQLNNEIKEHKRQESSVINGIKSIFKKEEATIINESLNKNNTINEFKNFCEKLSSHVLEHGKTIQEELKSARTSLEALTFDNSKFDELKSSMITEQDKLIATINKNFDADNAKRLEKLNKGTSQLNIHDHLRNQTNVSIQEVKKINSEIEAKQKEEEERRANDTRVSEQIIKIVTEQITQASPSIEAKIAENQEEQRKQQQERYEDIKKETSRIVGLIAQHKFIMDDAQIYMNTERESALSEKPEEKTEHPHRDQNDIMKELESVKDDITGITKSLETKVKDVDNIFQDGIKESKNGIHVSTKSKKKRQRQEDRDDVGGECEDGDFDSRYQYLDTHIQQLDDYVSQFRESVLEPMYPVRIETAMEKIKRTLLNHETFIAYLINPSLTSKDIEAGNSRQIELSLLHDILNIVKEEKEKASTRLHKRLKTLEDNLSTQ